MPLILPCKILQDCILVYLGTRYTIVGLVVITELKLGSLSSTPSTPNISSTEREKHT